MAFVAERHNSQRARCLVHVTLVQVDVQSFPADEVFLSNSRGNAHFKELFGFTHLLLTGVKQCLLQVQPAGLTKE